MIDALAGSVFRRIFAVVKLNINTARRGRFLGEAYRDYVGSFADYAALPPGFKGHPADALASSYATVYLGTAGPGGTQFDGSSVDNRGARSNPCYSPRRCSRAARLQRGRRCG